MVSKNKKTPDFEDSDSSEQDDELLIGTAGADNDFDFN